MSNFPLQYVRATQTGVYHVARYYGFQQFNFSPTGKKWVPAVAGLAADQLVSLLQDAATRRCATTLLIPGSVREWEGVWVTAIADVHLEYFEEYNRWCSKLSLPDPETQRQDRLQPARVHSRIPAHTQAPLQLLELALQFLIYTEAANLRHTPHLLFLIYYIMRGSQAFQQALVAFGGSQSTVSTPLDQVPHTHWRYWLLRSADNFSSNKPSGYDITSLRLNLLQQLHMSYPAAFHYPDPSAPDKAQEDEFRQKREQKQSIQAAVRAILTVNPNTPENPRMQELVQDVLQQLLDIFEYGSQQVFLNHVVQPLFYFLAEQMDLAGHQGGEEAALRIAYCDVDEACCSPGAVMHLIDSLKAEGWKRMEVLGSRHTRDLWNALLQVMQPLSTKETEAFSHSPKGVKKLFNKLVGRHQDMQGSIKDRYPRDPERVIVLENLKRLLQRSGRDADLSEAELQDDRNKALKHVTAKCYPGLTYEPEAISTVYQRAKYGAAWWSSNMFKAKTFVEARSMAAPFVAFWRVYTFHAVLFTAMMAVSLVLEQRGGVWGSGPVNWWQLMAALALSTVTDSLMRALRHVAYLMLYSYQRAVKRKQVAVGEQRQPTVCKLNPFPSGVWVKAIFKLLQLIAWLVWSAFLALCVLPVLVDLSQPLSRIPGLTSFLHANHGWLLPAAVHAVFIWGGSALRQKSGYTISWLGMMHELLEKLRRMQKKYSGGSQSWRKLAGHADCAADRAIDALFYPSRYLQVDRRRSWMNTLVWVVVILMKAAFEFFLIVQPLTRVIMELLRVSNELDIAKDAFAFNQAQVNTIADTITDNIITWFQVVAVSVPAALVCLCDTGLLFSVVGGLLSGIIGFYRGMGSYKTWTDLVSNYSIIEDSYKQHCVSRSALMLHLHGTSEKDMPHALQQLSVSALAAGWNALVHDLRQRDLLSNRELACVSFEHLLLDEHQEKEVRSWGLAPVLPARCFVAGAVFELTSAQVGSRHQLYAAEICWQWFCWLLLNTGLIQKNDMVGLLHLKLPHPARDREQAHCRHVLVKEAVKLLKLLSTSSSSPSNLKSSLAAATDPLGSTAAAAAGVRATAYTGLLHDMPKEPDKIQESWRSLLAFLETLIKGLRQELRELEGFFRSPGSAQDVECAASALNRLERLWTPWLQAEATADHAKSREAAYKDAMMIKQRAIDSRYLRHEMRKASMRDQQGAVAVLQNLATVGKALPAAAQVAGWLSDALTLLMGDTAPSDEEAQKFILNFAASLNDPNLKVAPSLHVMPSVTVLTPHYDEDVIYALNEADAWADIRMHNNSLKEQYKANMPADSSKLAQRDKVTYLMNADDSPAPTMTYLRSIYCRQQGRSPSQWDNFVERIKGIAAADGLDINSIPARVNEFHFLPNEPLHKYKEEFLLWASCRGQLLARTVRGMMTYRTALAALADYENPRVSATAATVTPRPSTAGGTTDSGSSLLQPDAVRSAILEDLLDRKFSYIVSSQNLGEFGSKVASDLKAAWLVHAIRTLMKRHPALKVAFIDKQPLVTASRPPGVKVDLRRDCSVLLCSVRQQGLRRALGMDVAAEEPQHEAYRVQLPINFESGRGVIIGEGKPENQNHAVIFCHSEAIQTIDCNQDNLVAEGLKLRNLLAEFLPDGWDQVQPSGQGLWPQFRNSLMAYRGVAATRKQGTPSFNNQQLLDDIPKGKGRVALVGFREWIFSEDSGALAEFAAATERSFGTTVQRVMHWPGAVRFHYGHPDVWRRSFVATCGGVSKANKGLHVSEDVFGGYNAILRGRDIKYVDYIAVGKGRDMSMETICMFEAKIASGNGEQVLSREIRRLGHSMDFTRLMTWYHTGNGFFINTAITMLSVHATVWVMLLLSFLQTSNTVIQNWLSAVQLLQLGALSVVVYWITLVLDAGLFPSVWIIIRQFLQGSLMFYIFRAQTSAYSFTQDLLFGGAKYLATGRGYKLQHTKFKDLWRRFGRSHMYFGAVLLVYCLAIIAAKSRNGVVTGLGSVLLVIWAPILVIVSLLFAPFWFTPFAFRTEVVQNDMDDTQRWFLSPSLTDSWHAWNKELTDVLSDVKGRQMGRFATGIRAHLFKLPTVLMFIAVTYRLDLRPGAGVSKVVVMVIVAAGIILLISVTRASSIWATRSAYKYQAPRLIQLATAVLLIGGVLTAGFAISGDAHELGNVPLVFFSMFIILRLLPLLFYNPLMRHWFGDLVNAVYFVADAALAALLECSLFVLSLFDILTGIQAQLLFNTAYAKQVVSDSALEQSEIPKLLTQALKINRQQRMYKQH